MTRAVGVEFDFVARLPFKASELLSQGKSILLGRRLDVRSIRVGRVANRIVGPYSIVITLVSLQARVGIAGNVGCHRRDLREGASVCGSLDLETLFVSGVVLPSQIDLSLGNRG